jgi:large subunit ribosomal protein L10
MNKERKIQVVEEYVSIFEKPGVYLMAYQGMNVAEISELRASLRKANVSMRVLRNTLAKRALKQAGIESFDSYFGGPVSAVWSHEDSIAPAREMLKFIEEHKKGSIKAGLVDGLLVTGEEIKAISKLPSKIELQAKLASVLNAPIVNFARVLNAVPTKFVRIIDAVREKKTEEAA